MPPIKNAEESTDAGGAAVPKEQENGMKCYYDSSVPFHKRQFAGSGNPSGIGGRGTSKLRTLRSRIRETRFDQVVSETQVVRYFLASHE